MFAEKKQYPPPKVGGNGKADDTGEGPKGYRSSQILRCDLGSCATVERILKSPGLCLLLS